MDIIYNILWIIGVGVLLALIGIWRGVLEWEDIKNGAKAVRDFFWSSTPGAPVPAGTSDSRFSAKKVAIIIFLAVVYIGSIVAFFVLGYAIAKYYHPMAGWPLSFFLSAIFIAKNSVKVPVAKFQHLLVWGFETNIRLRTGTYPLPFPGWLVGSTEYSTEKIPITLTVENIPNPDGTKATAVLKIEGVVHDIIKYTENGGAAGVQRNLMTRAEPCVKDYFQNETYGPQTHQEAETIGAEVLPSVLKALIGNKQLPKIPSVIPTPVLFHYFSEPPQGPTPTEAKKWGPAWERLIALLPTNPAELAKLKTALEERKEAIASLSNGTAHFIDQATGIAFETFTFDSITIQGGVPEETAKAAKEAAKGKASLTKLNDAIAQARAIVATNKQYRATSTTPMTPEQESDLFTEQLEKILVNLKLVDNGTATMHVIPGLAELAPLIAQLLGHRGGPTP